MVPQWWGRDTEPTHDGTGFARPADIVVRGQWVSFEEYATVLDPQHPQTNAVAPVICTWTMRVSG